MALFLMIEVPMYSSPCRLWMRAWILARVGLRDPLRQEGPGGVPIINPHGPTDRFISKDKKKYPPVQISRKDGQTLGIPGSVKVIMRSQNGPFESLRSGNGPFGPTVKVGGRERP